MDLAPHLDIDINRIAANVRQMNSDAVIIPISAKTGEGLEVWLDWVRSLVIQHQASLDPMPVSK
jgi:hydrogenase nickel incorporation protein HypB